MTRNRGLWAQQVPNYYWQENLRGSPERAVIEVSAWDRVGLVFPYGKPQPLDTCWSKMWAV